jgi:CBS domain-containing protein
MERDARLPLVRSFMSGGVLTLEETTPLGDAVERLRKWGYSGAPVVDAAGRVVGMFTEWDAMRVLAGAAWHELADGVVGDHMSRGTVSVGPDDDLFSVVAMFERSHFKRVPVIEDGRLVGIVARADVEDALWGVHQARHKARAATTRPPGAAWDPRQSAERDDA